MPIISMINLTEKAEQPVLSIRKTIRFDDFPALAGQTYTAIQGHLDQMQHQPAGSPFVCYHNTDLNNLDVEIGFPTAELYPSTVDIGSRNLPACRMVSGLFLGPYEESDHLMMQVMEWIASHGYDPGGQIYNIYLNDTNRPASEYLTRISIPIK